MTTALYILLILIILLTIVLSAVFSASEIASARCSKTRFEDAAENGDRTAAVITSISTHYVRTLSTILAGNNLVNIAATTAATVLFIGLIGAKGESVASVVVTVLLLLFGETCPKILAAGAPDRFMRLLAWPLRVAMIILFPIVWLVEKFVNLISPLWTPKEPEPQVTTEELAEIVEEMEDEGGFTEEESDLIRSAIEFADTTAYEVLTPRVDVVAIDIDDFNCYTDLTEELARHSRLPVYRENKDQIIGVLSLRRLMREMTKGNRDIRIEELMYEPLFVHKTCPLSTIIEEFKKKHIQIAVVVDEFGGMMGIVTLEDILEEIVGEIYDETDEPETDVIQNTQTVFTVDGSTNIYDAFDTMEYEPPSDFESAYTTVGGWATEMLDKFPEAGDEFTYDNLHVCVTEAQAMRVDTLQIEVLPKEEEEE